MKKVIILFSLCLVAALSYQCKKDGNPEEEKPAVVGNFDQISGKIGYHRVEIDLIKAGRVPASSLNFGTAAKTVVEYDGKKEVIDSLCSWVNITGLTESKAYKFKVYAVNADGTNPLEAKEITLTPYTAADLAKVTLQEPNTIVFGSNALLSWPYGVATGLADYYRLSYRYTGKSGTPKTGTVEGANPQFIASDLNDQTTVEIKYEIIPKQNYIAIIDTVPVNKNILLEKPAGTTSFEPEEEAILTANGINDFTLNGVASVQTLYYPLHTRSLGDIIYFSGLKTLDLTGGDKDLIPTLKYVCIWEPNQYQIVGGGSWLPFMKRMDNVNNQLDNEVAGTVILQFLLENNYLEKVRYIPNSMGLDNLLAPFVSSGKVELVTDFPNDVLIPSSYCVDELYAYVAQYYNMDLVFDPDDVPAGAEGAANVWKGRGLNTASAMAISLPMEYKFNTQEYPYLKFKANISYISDAYGQEFVTDVKRIFVSFLNMLTANSPGTLYPHPENTQRYLFNAPTVVIKDNQWVDVTIDASAVIAANAENISSRYVYAAIIAFGDAVVPQLPSIDTHTMTVYIADLRFSKTQ
jgi:hypothetical protein